MAVGVPWTDIWMAYGTWAGVAASCIATFLVIFSLTYTATALRAQKKSADVEAMLTIWERLDHHWGRLRLAKGADAQSFEFGQLISYYEVACSLFRYQAFSTTASIILGEHLRDVLQQMANDDSFKEMFAALKSHEDNYEQIRWFQVHGQQLITQQKRARARM